MKTRRSRVKKPEDLLRARDGFALMQRYDHNGYVRVRFGGWQFMEHRLIVGYHIGRPLERHETVHHINGVRSDNRIENLQVRVKPHGKGIAQRCRACGGSDIEQVAL